MARFTGPKTKVARRYGVPLFGPSKALERKNYPPGIHGPKGSRRKQSEFAIAQGEKQKLRYQYGLMEGQFRRYFATALRRRGVTGETLLQLLETRLDNVCYRLGFAISRRQARQVVRHGHVSVNGRKVNIPSFQCKVGDVVAVREGAKEMSLLEIARDFASGQNRPTWIAVDADGLSGRIVSLPKREEIHLPVNEQQIVELYSK